MATTAGVLLTRTPPLLNLRGARLVVLPGRAVRAGGAGPRLGRGDGGRPAAPPGAGRADSDRPAGRAGRVVGPGRGEAGARSAGRGAQGAPDAPGRGHAGQTRPHHLVFTGNSGTGKTRMARILGRMLADLGVLSSGHLVAVDRSDLVGEYTSESGTKVRRAVDRALGGVLCIEDAHDLTPGPDKPATARPSTRWWRASRTTTRTWSSC